MQSPRGADADREVADGAERGARCGLELPRSGSFSGSVRREWGLQWAMAEIYAQERLVLQQELRAPPPSAGEAKGSRSDLVN